MKILFFINTLKVGGKERQLVEIIKELHKLEKHKITLVLLSPDIFFDEIKSLNIDIFIFERKGKDFSIFFKFFQLCRKKNPDLIHTWDLMTTVYALPTAKILNIKLLNGSIRHGIRLNNFPHKFRTFIAKISPYVLANSEAGLKVNGLKKDNKHFVLYNGINKNFNKEKKNFSTGELKIISVSRLTPYKDYFTVLKALKDLKEEGYLFKYYIIGNGPLKNQIKETISKTGLQDNVFLLGLKKDVQKYLFEMDIFLHSSKGEGCSNVILEAMFAGLPIIASKTGGTPEIVTQENGFLFEYKNHIDLKNKLKKLFDNENLRIKFSHASFKLANNNYTTEIMIKNYLNILDRIIKK